MLEYNKVPVTCPPFEICPGSILLAKILLANSLRNCRKRNNLAENYAKKSLTNMAKIATITNVTRFKT